MSDLYDSLEDDNNENKASTFSLDLRKTDTSGPVKKDSESKSTEKYSFFLSTHTNGERLNPCPVFKPFSNEIPERKLILPKIISGCKEPVLEEPLTNIVVDSNSLLEQGLQFNNDGSFTKSPRPGEEELPFITREYRNLQFQKKKTYTLKKNVPVKCQKKNTRCSENVADNQVTTKQTKNTKSKKGLNEGVVISDSSLSCKPSQSKTMKKCASVGHSKHNPNLTDSMKEKLLLTLNEDRANNSIGESPKRNENKFPAAGKSFQEDRILVAPRRKTNGGKSQNLSQKGKPQVHELVSDKEKSKSVVRKIPKYKSDILLNAPKFKLNYWERHQLEKGFNPFFLRPERKRVPDDTNRSNFGDSVMEDLSEVSYRVLSCDNLGREEEEVFYQDLIQKDKTMKKAQRSSRSEGPLEFAKKGFNSFKEQKETLSGGSNLKSKRNSKAMFIDMPSECNHSVNSSKKFSHYCTSTSSSNLSKVELALKAKTYGYLVNARNIFKMKAQSEGKYGATETGSHERILNKKSELSTACPQAPRVVGKLIKQNSLPVNMFPNVKTEIHRKIQNLTRASVPWSKEKHNQEVMGIQRGLILPQVNAGQPKGGQMNSRLFEEIDFCLVSPNV